MLNPSGSHLLFFSERSMVNGDKDGETWRKNMSTGEQITISSKQLNISGSFQAQGSWLAVNNQVRNESAEHSIVLYNIESKKWKLISEPSDQLINGALWQDDSTMLVLTYVKGTTQEMTYTVNIDDLEDVQ